MFTKEPTEFWTKDGIIHHVYKQDPHLWVLLEMNTEAIIHSEICNGTYEVRREFKFLGEHINIWN